MPEASEEHLDRFPGFDTSARWRRWDQTTAGAVIARLGPPQPIRFFTPDEHATADALCRRLLALEPDCPVPVVAMIDARLAEAETDGWRYQELPEDGQAWRDSLAALEADAAERFQVAFARCTAKGQNTLIQAVQHLGKKRWHGLPAGRVWSLWTRYVCTAFYSHPYAWNEIGFPGPAYPQGYKNLGIDRREPHEVPDARPVLDPVRADANGGKGAER